MTSTNDIKDVKINQSSTQKDKSYYIGLYKSLDSQLNGECELRDRCSQLCEAWRRIHTLCLHSASSTHPHLLLWIQRHTARTVLLTEWQSPNSKEEQAKLTEAIDAFISECNDAIVARQHTHPWEGALLPRAECFKVLLADPWGHPILRALLDPEGDQPTNEEVLEWLRAERGVVFVARLRQLAMSKCDDLALTLLTRVMDRARHGRPPVCDSDDVAPKPPLPSSEPTFESILLSEAGFSDIWDILIDMEFVLLYKRDKRTQLIDLVKQTPLQHGYQIVERLLNRLESAPREKKIWKNAKEVAALITQVVIARCMVVPICSGGVRFALYWMSRALVRVHTLERACRAAAALAAPAATARHLHTVAAAVHAHHSATSKELSPFVVELYVRAITFGMNELEKLKLTPEKDVEARSTEQTLASWFLQLGLLLASSPRMKCECTLTAFSVHPSQSMYDRIKKAPPLPQVEIPETKIEDVAPTSEFGSWANDSRTMSNLVKTSETLNLKQLQQANVLSTAVLNEGEALGLSAELCQDIAVLLSGPRVKTLTWDMDRSLLLENCRIYMERTHEGTRALTTELKYLNLDPNNYLHLPEEDDDENDLYYGIEKGYEHLVEEQDPQPEEIWENAYNSVESEGPSWSDDEISSRKKKKGKTVTFSSESDEDPLSIVAESKRAEKKKERPHSKERSTEVKKKNKEAKKKEKKERKKKAKAEKSGLIAGLDDDPLAPSDFHISDTVTSPKFDENVVYDGHFSMDELKSPVEKIPENKNRYDKMKNQDHSKVSVEHNRAVQNDKLGPQSPISKSGFFVEQRPGNKPAVADKACSPMIVYPIHNNPMTSRLQVNEEVKKSIAKLIQFRRNKDANRPLTSPASSTTSPVAAALETKPVDNKRVKILGLKIHDVSSRNENDTKNTKVLNLASSVPKYSLQKQKGVTNESNVKPDNSSCSERSLSPALPRRNTEKQIHGNLNNEKHQEKTLQQSSAKCNTHLNSYQKFLEDLQKSAISRSRVPESSRPIRPKKRKEMKPISRVTPVAVTPAVVKPPTVTPAVITPAAVTPTMITPVTVTPPIVTPAVVTSAAVSPAAVKVQNTQSAKPVPLKKVENAPNTFARLSYMHKSKQQNIKPNTVEPNLYHSICEELERHVAEYKKIQAQSTASYANVSNIVKPTPVSNIQVSSERQKPNYLMSNRNSTLLNLLNTNTEVAYKLPNEMQSDLETQKTQTLPKSDSALTDKDQQEIMDLLGQKKSFETHSKVICQNLDESYNAEIKKVQELTSVGLQYKIIKVPAPVPYKDTKKLETIVKQSNVQHKVVSSTLPLISDSTILKTSEMVQNIKQHKKSSAINPKQPATIKINSKNIYNVVDSAQNLEPSKTISKKYTPKPPIPAPKLTEESEEQDWTKVMDALRAHRTPSRESSAVNMTFKNDSYNKSGNKNQTLKSSTNNPKVNSVPMISKISAIPTDATKVPLISDSTILKTPDMVQNITKSKKLTLQPALKNTEPSLRKQTPTSSKLSALPNPLIIYPEVTKQALQKEQDPFISGIPNSDYEILEELMDDDLRQEIGELLSDEEYYGTAPTKSVNKIIHTSSAMYDKTGASRTNVHTKPVLNVVTPKLVLDLRHKTSEMKPACSNVPTQNASKLRIISNEKIDFHKLPESLNLNSQQRTVTPIIRNPTTHNNSNVTNAQCANNGVSASNVYYTTTTPTPVPAVQNTLIIDPFGLYNMHQTITCNSPVMTVLQPQYTVANSVMINQNVPLPVVTIPSASSVQLGTVTQVLPIDVSYHPLAEPCKAPIQLLQCHTASKVSVLNDSLSSKVKVNAQSTAIFDAHTSNTLSSAADSKTLKSHSNENQTSKRKVLSEVQEKLQTHPLTTFDKDETKQTFAKNPRAFFATERATEVLDKLQSSCFSTERVKSEQTNLKTEKKEQGILEQTSVFTPEKMESHNEDLMSLNNEKKTEVLDTFQTPSTITSQNTEIKCDMLETQINDKKNDTEVQEIVQTPLIASEKNVTIHMKHENEKKNEMFEHVKKTKIQEKLQTPSKTVPEKTETKIEEKLQTPSKTVPEKTETKIQEELQTPSKTVPEKTETKIQEKLQTPSKTVPEKTETKIEEKLQTPSKTVPEKTETKIQEKLHIPSKTVPEKTESTRTVIKNQEVWSKNKKKADLKDTERLHKKRLAIQNRNYMFRSFYPPIPLAYTPINNKDPVRKNNETDSQIVNQVDDLPRAYKMSPESANINTANINNNTENNVASLNPLSVDNLNPLKVDTSTVSVKATKPIKNKLCTNVLTKSKSLREVKKKKFKESNSKDEPDKNVKKPIKNDSLSALPSRKSIRLNNKKVRNSENKDKTDLLSIQSLKATESKQKDDYKSANIQNVVTENKQVEFLNLEDAVQKSTISKTSNEENEFSDPDIQLVTDNLSQPFNKFREESSQQLPTHVVDLSYQTSNEENEFSDPDIQLVTDNLSQPFNKFREESSQQLPTHVVDLSSPEIIDVEPMTSVFIIDKKLSTNNPSTGSKTYKNSLANVKEIDEIDLNLQKQQLSKLEEVSKHKESKLKALNKECSKSVTKERPVDSMEPNKKLFKSITQEEITKSSQETNSLKIGKSSKKIAVRKLSKLVNDMETAINAITESTINSPLVEDHIVHENVNGVKDDSNFIQTTRANSTAQCEIKKSTNFSDEVIAEIDVGTVNKVTGEQTGTSMTSKSVIEDNPNNIATSTSKKNATHIDTTQNRKSKSTYAYDIPQEYKDSVYFEEIPIPGNVDPYKKCVNVIMPGNKKYRATIIGKMQVNFDTLFDDPNVRKILLGGFSRTTKYTLNVKQVSSTNQNIDPRIKSVQIGKQVSVKPTPHVLDTVNLVSDEEDCDDNAVPSLQEEQNLYVKFGDFKVNKNDLVIHKDRLSSKCSITLEKYVAQPAVESLLCNENLGSTEIIEIDSSDDDDSFEKRNQQKIVELKNVLLDDLRIMTADLNVTPASPILKELPKRTRKSKYDKICHARVKPLEEKMKSKSKRRESEKLISNSNYDVNKHQTRRKHKTETPTIRPCFINLVKCDALLSKYCRIDREQVVDCDQYKNSPENLRRNTGLMDTYKLHKDIERASSPVVEVFETISKLRELDLLGRTSPVMEVFDMISNLQKSVTIKPVGVRYECHEEVRCTSEWLHTKRKLRKLQMDNAQHIRNKSIIPKVVIDNVVYKSFSHIVENNSKHALECGRGDNTLVNVPSLVSIMSKYFEDNPLVLQLMPLLKPRAVSLKRKLTQDKTTMRVTESTRCSKNFKSDADSYQPRTGFVMGTSLLPVENKTLVPNESTKNSQNIIEDCLSQSDINFVRSTTKRNPIPFNYDEQIGDKNVPGHLECSPMETVNVGILGLPNNIEAGCGNCFDNVAPTLVCAPIIADGLAINKQSHFPEHKDSIVAFIKTDIQITQVNENLDNPQMLSNDSDEQSRDETSNLTMVAIAVSDKNTLHEKLIECSDKIIEKANKTVVTRKPTKTVTPLMLEDSSTIVSKQSVTVFENTTIQKCESQESSEPMSTESTDKTNSEPSNNAVTTETSLKVAFDTPNVTECLTCEMADAESTKLYGTSEQLSPSLFETIKDEYSYLFETPLNIERNDTITSNTEVLNELSLAVRNSNSEIDLENVDPIKSETNCEEVFQAQTKIKHDDQTIFDLDGQIQSEVRSEQTDKFQSVTSSELLKAQTKGVLVQTENKFDLSDKVEKKTKCEAVKIIQTQSICNVNENVHTILKHKETRWDQVETSNRISIQTVPKQDDQIESETISGLVTQSQSEAKSEQLHQVQAAVTACETEITFDSDDHLQQHKDQGQTETKYEAVELFDTELLCNQNDHTKKPTKELKDDVETMTKCEAVKIIQTQSIYNVNENVQTIEKHKTNDKIKTRWDQVEKSNQILIQTVPKQDNQAETETISELLTQSQSEAKSEQLHQVQADTACETVITFDSDEHLQQHKNQGHIETKYEAVELFDTELLCSQNDHRKKPTEELEDKVVTKTKCEAVKIIQTQSICNVNENVHTILKHKETRWDQVETSNRISIQTVPKQDDQIESETISGLVTQSQSEAKSEQLHQVQAAVTACETEITFDSDGHLQQHKDQGQTETKYEVVELFDTELLCDQNDHTKKPTKELKDDVETMAKCEAVKIIQTQSIYNVNENVQTIEKHKTNDKIKTRWDQVEKSNQILIQTVPKQDNQAETETISELLTQSQSEAKSEQLHQVQADTAYETEITVDSDNHSQQHKNQGHIETKYEAVELFGTELLCSQNDHRKKPTEELEDKVVTKTKCEAVKIVQSQSLYNVNENVQNIEKHKGSDKIQTRWDQVETSNQILIQTVPKQDNQVLTETISEQETQSQSEAKSEQLHQVQADTACETEITFDSDVHLQQHKDQGQTETKYEAVELFDTELLCNQNDHTKKPTKELKDDVETMTKCEAVKIIQTQSIYNVNENVQTIEKHKGNDKIKTRWDQVETSNQILIQTVPKRDNQVLTETISELVTQSQSEAKSEQLHQVQADTAYETEITVDSDNHSQQQKDQSKTERKYEEVKLFDMELLCNQNDHTKKPTEELDHVKKIDIMSDEGTQFETRTLHDQNDVVQTLTRSENNDQIQTERCCQKVENFQTFVSNEIVQVQTESAFKKIDQILIQEQVEEVIIETKNDPYDLPSKIEIPPEDLNISNENIDWVVNDTEIETERTSPEIGLLEPLTNDDATEDEVLTDNKLIQTDMYDNNNFDSSKDVSGLSKNEEIATFKEKIKPVASTKIESGVNLFSSIEVASETVAGPAQAKDDTHHSALEKINLNLEINDDLLSKTTVVYKDDSGAILKGIKCNDPKFGTCLIFPVLGSKISNSINMTNINNDTKIPVLNKVKIDSCWDSNTKLDRLENANQKCGEQIVSHKNVEMCVNKPQFTYSKFSLKRKSDMTEINFREKRPRRTSRSRDSCDTKVNERKYRKGKNIDIPKTRDKIECAYAKEYKCMIDYISSVKFSYNMTYDLHNLKVLDLLNKWPIQGRVENVHNEIQESSVLFVEEEDKTPRDPMRLTLVEELNLNYNDNDYTTDTFNTETTNFNKGFGERSGRVIQNLSGGVIPKFSAATLSDVKHSQPLSLSGKDVDKTNYEQHLETVNRFLSTIRLRNKVRSFFEKTAVELNRDSCKKEEESTYACLFPFDSQTCINVFPKSLEFIVHVVQVGQLPVSAAAQNPVTCDPRVTQVSDASPSQCSVVNSPHDDSQSEIKTEYTELTTADLSLPLVEDYVQHNQANIGQQDSNKPVSSENIPIQTELEKPEVKFELAKETDEKEKHISNNDSETKHANKNEYHFDTNNSMSYESNDRTTFPKNYNSTYETDNGNSFETNDTFEANNSERYQAENTNTYETNDSTSYESSNNNAYEVNENSAYPSNTNSYDNTNSSSYETNHTYGTTNANSVETEMQALFGTEKSTTPEPIPQKPLSGVAEKTDQIAHAMNAAGITASEPSSNTRAHALVNLLSQKIRPSGINPSDSSNAYPKAASINAMALQQALAQILPPPLNQTNASDNSQQGQNITPQVLHIVQGKNVSGNQITLVDNSQQSVISGPNTPVLHIVQNKAATSSSAANGSSTPQTNSFGGISLVDAGLQQGGNQLLHIVNTGSQKNNATGQLLKRVNLLTNLSNVQGSNEHKMVQFVCKSADGKAIQLNAPHQRSMVLRLQPIETPNMQTTQKSTDNQNLSPTQNSLNNAGKDSNTQEIKSRSVYEENYAKFIQSSSNKPTVLEKATSLPKFNQAFGKPVFQDDNQKQNEISNNIPNVESSECTTDNSMNLDHISQISSPPLLLRKSPAQTSQAPTNLVQHIKQTIAPMNIQTMHGGVIYTRQIPVNIGGGQTINLITVPSTELIDDSGQKQLNQGDIEPSIIKIVPQSQPQSSTEINSDDISVPSENNTQNPQQPQPVLTQMRIKLPMLSKAPQMVSGARVVRPSFFQIQRNVIGGTASGQPVYQQLVLTAAPPLGHQTIRLPQARQIKVPESQSSESQMSSSTLEQLREFDMVLEQVKERSTVQPSASNFKVRTNSTDTTDSAVSSNSTPAETTQVLYSIGNSQSLNVTYVNRKASTSTPTTSTFVRSPDSSGIADSPSSSTSHAQIPHTVTTETSSSETVTTPKPKSSSKSKSRPKSSSNPPMKLNTTPPKTSAQKPLEDEQTTQRILYILAEYKEQVENSPDKDKPAPRRRSNPPSNPGGSSKRKKSSSGSRRSGRDLSPVHGDDTCRTMGSEDSSCGTSQGDCNESCLESHSPQDSPRKVARKLTFEQENALSSQQRQQHQRNVIVADGQTITVARGTAGKPATAVLMPANYILPVSMVKGGQQIAIVTNRGPKLLTVGGGEGTTNALLLQRLIGPAGLKPVLTRPGVRHVRLPTAALHNLQAFNLTTAATVQPPDSTAAPAAEGTPPDLEDTRAETSPWTDHGSEPGKPDRANSPDESEPWHLPADPHDYSYEETVRTDNMDRTVLDPIPDRYSPDMEAQRIFDKMFDVDSKKSYIVDSQVDSPRCAYDIDASDCDDKPYQVVQKKDISAQRQARLAHVSAAALRHKYAILEHELRLQKSLSEECEDLGVDSPSASELFPEAELLFAASPAQDHASDTIPHPHTRNKNLNCAQPTILNQNAIQPDIDDQIATDQLIQRDGEEHRNADVNIGLEDVGIVTVNEDGMQATIALDQEEFARSHPNTTFHSEPTDEGEVQPFAISGLKSRHITSTIFHSNRAPATVLMTAPQATVISQATPETSNTRNNIKYAEMDMMNSMPSTHANNINMSSVLVKDDGLTRFDNILTDTRELHLSNTASAIVHSAGNATQVIRRVCYDDDKRERFLIDEPDALIAGDDAKMMAEDSRDATLDSMRGDVDDGNSSPERHAELFWESNSASERSEGRRPLDFSSDSEKCCKSPSYDETNSTDSSGVGTHMRLDSVIKDARGIERSASADGSSADDTHPPLRTYPPKRMYHNLESDVERSLSGKTRAGERSPDLEVRRRASGRGVVKRGCHCCNGSPAPPRPKKAKQRKPTMDFTTH